MIPYTADILLISSVLLNSVRDGHRHKIYFENTNLKTSF